MIIYEVYTVEDYPEDQTIIDRFVKKESAEKCRNEFQLKNNAQEVDWPIIYAIREIHVSED